MSIAELDGWNTEDPISVFLKSTYFKYWLLFCPSTLSIYFLYDELERNDC